MEKEIVRIRLDLEGKDAKEFLQVKEDRGITSNTETVRLLVRDAYKQICKAEAQ
jgi:hypothetical protein